MSVCVCVYDARGAFASRYREFTAEPKRTTTTTRRDVEKGSAWETLWMYVCMFVSRFPLYYMSLIYFITFKIKIPNNMWRYFISHAALLLFKSSVCVCRRRCWLSFYTFSRARLRPCTYSSGWHWCASAFGAVTGELFEVFMSFATRFTLRLVSH